MLSQNVSPMLQTGHSLCQGKNCQASAKRHKYLGVKGACLLYFTKPFLCFHSLMSIVNSCTPAEKQTVMLPPLLLPIGCFPITFCLFQKPFASPPATTSLPAPAAAFLSCWPGRFLHLGILVILFAPPFCFGAALGERHCKMQWDGGEQPGVKVCQELRKEELCAPILLKKKMILRCKPLE